MDSLEMANLSNQVTINYVQKVLTELFLKQSRNYYFASIQKIQLTDTSILTVQDPVGNVTTSHLLM